MSNLLNLFDAWVVPSLIIAPDYSWNNESHCFAVIAKLSTGQTVAIADREETDGALEVMKKCVDKLRQHELASAERVPEEESGSSTAVRARKGFLQSND